MCLGDPVNFIDLLGLAQCNKDTYGDGYSEVVAGIILGLPGKKTPIDLGLGAASGALSAYINNMDKVDNDLQCDAEAVKKIGDDIETGVEYMNDGNNLEELLDGFLNGGC